MELTEAEAQALLTYATSHELLHHSSLVGSRGASWHILLLDAAQVRRERALIRWESVGGGHWSHAQ